MTLDQFFAAAASAGTCVAAVLALLSLRETAKQRRAADRPELAVRRQSVHVNNIRSSPAWTREKPSSGSQSQQGRAYTITLFNIGLGAAKGAVITWDFNDAGLISEIGRLFKKHGVKTEVRILETDDSVVEIVDDRRKWRAMFSRIGSHEQNVDFILPYKADEVGIECVVPALYLQLVSMYFDATLPLGDKENEPVQSNLLRARMTVSYADIGGQPYTQQFDFNLKLEMFERQPDDANFVARLTAENASNKKKDPRHTNQVDAFGVRRNFTSQATK